MREPRRIAMLAYSTQPRGGVQHALALAEALQASGDDVTLYAVDRAGARFSREPACRPVVIDVEPRAESLAEFVRRRSDAFVARLERDGTHYDVYHAQDGIAGDALRRLYADGTITSYVRTVHHLTRYDDERVTEIDAASIRAARHVFAVSGRSRTELRDRFAIDASVVGNGVDLARFPARGRVRARTARSVRYLTIGGIEERKNTVALLDAFAIVRRSDPEARLTIAGGASVLDHTAYRRMFDARLRAHGASLASAVEIVGPLGDRELIDRLHRADAFVFPSIVEGFGLVVLEALACGTPVVVSGIEPFVDYLHADDAIFVAPDDPAAIAAGMLAACVPQTGARLRERGPQVAARFPWSAVARACRGGYDA